MPHLSTPMPRLVLLPLALAALASCRGDAPPADRADAAPPPAASAEPPPAASTGAAAGRWSGDVTGGYQGNRVSFVVSEGGSRVSDVTFEGHWDCADGIETTTAGPGGTYPVADGRIDITSVEPEDGGATATRFVMEGRMEPARAEGTLRINLNALGCDTRVLRWTATPGGE